MHERIITGCLVLLLTSTTGLAQTYRPITIPTRVTDAGKQYLVADLYAMDTTTPKPVILIQTPYNKAFYRLGLGVQGSNGAAVPYDSVKYNYVIVDWRGYYTNKDADITPYNRGLDGYDIVEWIATQPWSNGKIGTWGGSALGSIQFMTAAEHPPHLVCAAPFIYDYKTEYSDYYYGGVLRKEYVESLEKLGFISKALILNHQTEDAYSKIVAQTTDIPEKIEVPVFMATGWFDHFPSDVIRAFGDIRAKGSGLVSEKHRLMIGPWGHSEMGVPQQGDMTFANAAGVPAVEGMRFFDHFLLDAANGWDTDPSVRYYQMGDTAWRTADNWYAVGQYSDTLYLHDQGLLLASKEVASTTPDTLVADPRNPVPTVGGARFNPFDRNVKTGPIDLFAITQRNDVLSFVTQPLTEELTMDGSVKIKLYFACTTPDADISVRLSDVQSAPDNRWMIMTQGIKRLRFRKSFQTESLLAVNTIDSCTVDLQELGLTIKRGHRMAISISGSNYPMFDLNLNDGGPMYVAGDTTISHTLIHHSSLYPSSVIYETPTKRSDVDYSQSTPSNKRQSIRLSPIPATDFIDLTIDDPPILTTRNCTYDIIEGLGRTLSTGICVDGYQRINVRWLAPGVYAIRVAGHTRMFVKD